MREDTTLALQRCLVEAALMPEPGPPERDPGAFAAARGLSGRDQAAFRRFKDRLPAYRHLIRSDLVEPVEANCVVTRTLLEQAGAWDDCVAGFLASRGVQSLFYRDLSATFLGWLAATGWGQDRWPYLLQLAHYELLTALVERHPGEGPAPPGLHPGPRVGDRVRLAAPSQLVTYAYHVHQSTPERPEPDLGEVHLMAFRDRQGAARWMELAPGTVALLQGAQKMSIGQAAMELGLEDLSQAVELLAGFQCEGAILGFLA